MSSIMVPQKANNDPLTLSRRGSHMRHMVTSDSFQKTSNDVILSWGVIFAPDTPSQKAPSRGASAGPTWPPYLLNLCFDCARA